MPKSRCCLLFLLLSGLQAAAQQPDDEYYPYSEREELREMVQRETFGSWAQAYTYMWTIGL